MSSDNARNLKDEQPDNFIVVKTSASSGFVTVRSNLSEGPPYTLVKSLPVPPRHTAMVSYREAGPDVVDVTLSHHSVVCDQAAGRWKQKRTVLWWRRYSPESDFAHVVHAGTLRVQVHRASCVVTRCFRLFFSFFPENETLHGPARGAWNCSVDHYPSFRHHLACNLKTECLDGRDETGRCPLSSADCRGLMAMCRSCYLLTENIRGDLDLDSDERDVNNRADKLCRSLGGALRVPRCTAGWYDVLRNMTAIHERRVNGLLVGLFSNDVSLPNVYRHAVIHQDRTVYHHSVRVKGRDFHGTKQCFTTHYGDSLLHSYPCESNHLRRTITPKTLCEFRGRHTREKVSRFKRISLRSTHFQTPTEGQTMTQCPKGHVTHTFIVCGSNNFHVCHQEDTRPCVFSGPFQNADSFHHSDHQILLVTVFKCNDKTNTLSYTLVCDFISDCQDRSDESLCEYALCNYMFSCPNGQCLPFNKVCDQISHCQDESDENSCSVFRAVYIQHMYFPSPSTVNFDGIRQFLSTPMNSSESCPDSHYRCPGAYNDCLPVYTRCNGMYDCVDHQDEEGCEDMTCPGLFRCRESITCVHSDQLCDGWPHCPKRDDELVCGVVCPAECLCQGHSFLCRRPFSSALFPELRYLDATSSGMTLSEVSRNTKLVHLVLAHCSLTRVAEVVLFNLRFLDLSANRIQHANMTSILGLVNLQVLSLFQNPLSSLCCELFPGVQQRALTVVDLSRTPLTVFDTKVFSPFPNVHKLNLSSTSIHTINTGGFQFTPRLTELYMDGSPVKAFPMDVFRGLSNLQFVHTENYKLCCNSMLPYNFDESSCYAPKDEISSCEDLLQSWMYRAFLWTVASLSLLGNVFCFSARWLGRSMASSSGFSVFVTNLTMADFLMGVYIAIIGAADARFRGQYFHFDDTWKSSVTCKAAGFLSLLSSEVSALIIWLITLDRFVVIRFPFSTMRFERLSAMAASLMTWLVGWFLAVLPLLPVASHWEFYSQTGICIPLPVTRQEFTGKSYSFSVLIVLNFALFVLISAGQGFIYWSIQSNAMKSNSTKVSQDMTIARRLISVAVTDFLCWFPIGLCGFLSLAGIPIPGEVNVALAVFVLPLNSAINPFVYTFNTLAEKRRTSREAKLLKWMEFHSDSILS